MPSTSPHTVKTINQQFSNNPDTRFDQMNKLFYINSLNVIKLKRNYKFTSVNLEKKIGLSPILALPPWLPSHAQNLIFEPLACFPRPKLISRTFLQFFGIFQHFSRFFSILLFFYFSLIFFSSPSPLFFFLVFFPRARTVSHLHPRMVTTAAF